ncbi:MAG TPA: pseudouridine synthase [Thermoanaerobaculia bacterium]|jgi:23S rRNA pseudouridine2605 synthase|nr:pseudouridine synthase [Thermoanaerobaculia bacterium]
MELDRLQKIIAHAGFASRREAETMIREGRVTVNGRVVTELGSKADPANDHIKVDGKLITRAETHRYILLYKPKEVMTTVEDPQGRKTVIQLVKGVRERIYPIGRLDFHSEGLILLTNDGDLAYKVSHPKHGSVKTYHVKVRGVPEERLVDKLRRGITIDGKRTLPCDIERMKTTGRSDDEGNSWFEVLLREGRTQQIRKMFKAVGHPVSKLRRVAIGPISDPKLTPGDWRELTPREVKLLATNQEPAKPKARRVPTARASVKKTAANASAAQKRGATPARKAKPPARKSPGSSRKSSAGPRKASPRPATPRTAPPRKAAGATRRGRG